MRTSDVSSPEDRLDELTTLLASGLLRISPQALATLDIPPDSSMEIPTHNQLAECEISRLHGAK